jgi:hypothetical protein
LLFSFSRKNDNYIFNCEESNIESDNKLIWNADKVPLFRSNILNNNYDVRQSLNEIVRNEPIDHLLQKFTDLLLRETRAVFDKEFHRYTHDTGHRSTQKWFDADCVNVKRDFKRKRNIFYRDKSETNRTLIVSARTNYNLLNVKR